MAKYNKNKNGIYVFDKRIAGKRCMLRGKTCAEIDKKLKDWLAKQAAEAEEKEKGPLFEDVAKKWYHSAEKNLSYSTMRLYKARLETALDEFSGYRMNEIRPIDITRLYEKMAKQGFSSKTIIHERTVLRNIFNYRNFTDGTDYNPAAIAKPAKGKAPVVRQPVPEEAVIAVMQHTDGFGIVPCLFAFTGARLGEIMAIQVSDIDFDRNLYGCKGSIKIGKSVQWRGSTPVLKEPKTEAGVREIPILNQFRPILLAAVAGLKKDDFVVSRSDKPLTARAYDRRWQMYCREIGLAREIKIPSKRPQRDGKTYMITEYRATITAHQFRHLMATACVEANIPEYIGQKILGHKSIQTTIKHYTHIREQALLKSYSEINKVSAQITQQQ